MNISDKDVTIHQQYLNARDHVKKLLKICKNEILKIEYCGDCYKNRVEPNYFTLVCSKPHPLLWAKFDKYPYWPANLISVKENHLYVQFFGDHTAEDIPYNKCYMYSKEDPNEWCTTQEKDKFQKSVDVSIDNLTQRNFIALSVIENYVFASGSRRTH